MRENRQLKSPKIIPELLSIHNTEEDFTNNLDLKRRAQFLLITKAYKDHIHNLQKQLNKLPSIGALESSTVIEGGEYVIGSESPFDDELPLCKISVNAFRIDLSPVTNKQFGDFIIDSKNSEWLPEAIYKKYDIPYCLCEFIDNSYPRDKWDHPVVWINWYMAAAYCNWRSKLEKREEVYVFISNTEVRADLSKNGWRLPTENEWEIAARAGNLDRFPFDSSEALFKSNFGKHYEGTTAVGRFHQNSWGLFDMVGNIKEWCNDDWIETQYLNQEINDKQKTTDTSTRKLFKGSSWMDMYDSLRFSRRGKIYPQNTNPDFGFRCVRKV